jgi:hypothetical protein
MTEAATLWVLTETEAEVSAEKEGQRSGGDRGGGFGLPIPGMADSIPRRQRVSLDAQALQAQMTSLLAVVNDLFTQADLTTGLQLQEVELSVDINAEGQISLVGNGGKLGNQGGIKLRLTRPVDR